MRADRSGVSPIISTMLILLLMVTMITTVLLWGAPTIEDFETASQYSSMRGLMNSIDGRVDFLVEMGTNTSVSMDVTVPPGTLAVETEVEFWTIDFLFSNENLNETAFFRYSNFEKNVFNDDGRFTISSNYDGTVDIIIFWPEDGAEQSQHGLDMDGTVNISTSNPVTRTFIVTILDEEGEALSGCLVFPVRGIRGDFASPKGRFAFRSVNGGVVTEYPDPSNPKMIRPSLYVESVSAGFGIPQSTVMEGNGQLILNIMDFRSTGLDRVGQGNCKMEMSYKELITHDVGPVKDVRITVYSKFRDPIYNGYTSGTSGRFSSTGGITGFVEEPDGGSISFHTGDPSIPGSENPVVLRINEHFIDVAFKGKG